MANNLSREDVTRLMTDPSPDHRSELAAKVARNFDGPQLSDAERRLAEDIIRLMAKDAVIRVRQSLAENLKASQRLPRDIALTLARDVEEVALPLLSVSTVLSDADLIEIVQIGVDAKNTAIARRPNVAGAVADALIERGSEGTVAALVANEGAELREESLGRVLDRFGDSQAVQGPLVHRSHLPITIAERLVAVASESLRQHLATHHDLPAGLAADLILRSRESATVSLMQDSGTKSAERLIAQLHRTGRLTPSLVLRALCVGDVTFFEVAIAALAGVPLDNARLLIHDVGPLGLKSIYDRAGQPAALLPACRVALDVARETVYDGEKGDIKRRRRRMIERILTQYEALAAEDLDYLLDKLGDLITPDGEAG